MCYSECWLGGGEVSKVFKVQLEMPGYLYETSFLFPPSLCAVLLAVRRVSSDSRRRRMSIAQKFYNELLDGMEDMPQDERADAIGETAVAGNVVLSVTEVSVEPWESYEESYDDAHWLAAFVHEYAADGSDLGAVVDRDVLWQVLYREPAEEVAEDMVADSGKRPYVPRPPKLDDSSHEDDKAAPGFVAHQVLNDRLGLLEANMEELTKAWHLMVHLPLAPSPAPVPKTAKPFDVFSYGPKWQYNYNGTSVGS